MRVNRGYVVLTIIFMFLICFNYVCFGMVSSNENIYCIDCGYIYRMHDNEIDIIGLNDYYDMDCISSIDIDRLTHSKMYIYGDKLFVSGILEEDNRYYAKIVVYDIFDKNNPRKISEFMDYGYNYFLKENNGVMYVCIQKDESKVEVLCVDLKKHNVDFNNYEFEGDESNFIYISNDSLYVICNEDMVDKHFTTIHKFSIHGDKLRYINKISFDGNILNEKFIDEFEDNLRVLGYCGNYKNRVYVFDKDLNGVNCIDIILENENISNIYFDGGVCYISGFSNGGYFSIYDLNYSNPREVGRIAFSSSLNSIYKCNDNKFVIVGNEQRADTYKNFQSDKVYEILKNTGIKIYLVDVSDLNKPNIVDEYVIKGKEMHVSTFEDNTKLVYSKENNILAFPLEKVTYNSEMDINSAMEVFNPIFSKDILTGDEEFTGIYVFDVDKSIGLKFIINSDSRIDSKSIDNITFFEDNIIVFSKNGICVFDLLGGMKGEYIFKKKETI